LAWRGVAGLGKAWRGSARQGGGGLTAATRFLKKNNHYEQNNKKKMASINLQHHRYNKRFKQFNRKGIL
jgi:hypothetical protein